MDTVMKIPPPHTLKKPLNVPQTLLMGPGPSNCPPQILNASRLQMLGHLDNDFLQIMADTKEGIKYAFQTTNEYTFALSGTGHFAMETAITSLLDEGEKLLCIVNGIWGERALEIGKRIGAQCYTLEIPLGSVASLEKLNTVIAATRPSVLFVCHGESSTGVLQSLEGIGEICHKYQCLLVVDAVASLGASPVYMDSYEIDVLYTTSQKVLNAPPGISPISFSPRAIEKVKKTKKKSFYMDVLLIGNYWNCDDKSISYHHTGPINLIYALREAFSILSEETLEKSWLRHKKLSIDLHNGLENLGLQLLVPEKKNRLPTVTAVKVPSNVNGQKVIKLLRERYNIDIAGGLGPTSGRIWRIGLMGYNCSKENVQFMLKAMTDILKENISCKL